MMDIKIEQACLNQKSTLEKLLREYLLELHSTDKEVSADIKDYKYFDLYWIEQERIPCLIYAEEKVAGFIFINEYSVLEENKGAKAIAEFFILPEFRNKGIGEKVAFMVFNRFPGKWEITVMKENKAGLKFWDKIVAIYTKGKFQKIIMDSNIHKGSVYSFVSY
ncbi:GNAT family N-acetyltransferase [Patescibacteria group bacterium]|nr:GNAT family N-acetyltransferase [Patescibacteria group bacterium]